MLSNFGFKFKLRRYNPGGKERQRENFHKNVVGTRMYYGDMLTEVKRCRLPVSKPDLKPPMVSALETKM
jgi:hypothetical protein